MGEDATIVVEVTGDSVEAIAPQIPRADEGDAVVRIAVKRKARGLFAKLLAHGAPVEAIGSALLARGWTGISAKEEDGTLVVRGRSGTPR